MDALFQMRQARVARACALEFSARAQHRDPVYTMAMSRALQAVPNHPEVYAAELAGRIPAAMVRGAAQNDADRAAAIARTDAIMDMLRREAAQNDWHVVWPYAGLPSPTFQKQIVISGPALLLGHRPDVPRYAAGGVINPPPPPEQ